MKRIVVSSVLLALALAPAVRAQSWVPLSPPYPWVVSSCWIDESSPDRAWFVGWRQSGPDPVSYGYRTVDGGASFQYVAFNYYFWLARDVDFVDSSLGLAVGAGIIRTVNGGDSWDVIVDLITMRGWLYDLAYADATHALAVGQTYDDSYSSYWGVIYRSDNAGASWHSAIVTREQAGENTEFRAVAAPPGALYIGALNTAGGATLFKSVDDGASWSPLPLATDVNALWFASSDTGLAATAAGLLRTTDGGAHWQNVQPTAAPMLGLEIEDSRGFAVGDAGLIYRTADRGLHWTAMASPVTQSLYHVDTVPGGVAYAVGAAGTILKYDALTGAGGPVPGPRLALASAPNPFNPATTIRYEVPATGPVTLQVFDARGRLVDTLLAGEQSSGPHEIRFDASRIPSGVYACRLTAGSARATIKLTVAK